jgi:restriction system protein
MALEQNLAIIGWEKVGDLARFQNRDELLAALKAAYPEESMPTLTNYAGQLWNFSKEIKPGDLVGMPLKQRPHIAFGEVTGPYEHRPDLPPSYRNTVPVRWLKEIPRSQLDQDLLHSFGAIMTVCQIRRNNAEERIRRLIKNWPITEPPPPPTSDTPPPPPPEDLEEIALDHIRKLISEKFKGHRLADLVAALLVAKGFKVQVSPPGPDGGVDILAGSGELGFDNPRLVVQVKSSEAPVDVRPLRELQGVMKTFQASQGLFVSWGGFKSSVDKEFSRLYFEIRCWGPDQLLREIFQHYEQLPEDIQAELPLKRIWVPVPPSEGKD